MNTSNTSLYYIVYDVHSHAHGRRERRIDALERGKVAPGVQLGVVEELSFNFQLSDYLIPDLESEEVFKTKCIVSC